MTLASFYADEENHVIPFDGIVLFPAWHVKHPQAGPRPWSSFLSPIPKADITMPLLGGGDYQMHKDFKPKDTEESMGKMTKTTSTLKADMIMPLLEGEDDQMQKNLKAKDTEGSLVKTMKTTIPLSKDGQEDVATGAQNSGDAVDVLPVHSVMDPPIGRIAAEDLSVRPKRTRFTKLRRLFCLGHSHQDN